jgi:hypothetical protein
MTPDPEDDGVPPLSDIPRPMPPKFLCSTPLALEMMKDMVPECEDGQCTICADTIPRIMRFPDREEYESYLKKEPLKWDELTIDHSTWTPPPNTAVLVAKLKEDEGVR